MAKRNLMGLQFSHVTGVLQLEAPDGCKASVLLRSVGNDSAAEYVWWLSVGRQGRDALTVPVDCNGAIFIRCDVPEDTLLSEQAIRNGLDNYLLTAGSVSTVSVSLPGPRIGGPNSGNGDGGGGPINPG